MQKNRPSTICTAIVLAGLPIGGHCSSQITANITKFGVLGNGGIYVQVDKAIDQAGCPGSPYMEITPDNPAAKYILATVSIAFSTGAQIIFTTDGCTSYQLPTISTRNGHLIMLKP